MTIKVTEKEAMENSKSCNRQLNAHVWREIDRLIGRS